MIMSNKLKKMLDQEENGLSLTMSFKNLEDRNEFINNVKQIEETGIPKSMPIPRLMEIKKTNGGYQYPVKNIENVIELKAYLSRGHIDVPVFVEGVEDKYSFFTMVTENAMILKTVNSKVIDVKLDWKIANDILNFTYTSHPENADTIDELILEYKRFLALLNVLFQNEKSFEKLKDVKKYFNQSLNMYIRRKELGEILGIDLTPNMIIGEEDGDYLVEKAYLLLIKKSIIRQNDKLKHIEMADIEHIEIGQKLFATYCQKCDLDIFEKNIDLYTANCIFGAEIQKVEKKENGSSVVYFKDSEEKPMYRAYSAFLDEREAEKEMRSIINKREQYEDAISWIDQLCELLND